MRDMRKRLGVSPLRKMRRRARRGKAILVLLGFLLLFAFAAAFSHYRGVRIETVYVAGNNVTPTEDILFLVRKRIAGNYAFLFARDNIALFPRSSIEEGLLQEVPRIRGVDIRRESFTSIKVTVEERTPVSLWCRENDNECYFLDEKGFVFSLAPQFTSGIYERFYGSLSSSTPLRSSFLDEGSFGKALFLLGQMEKLGIVPVTIRYAEGDLDVRDESGVSILFAKSDDYSTIFSNLEAAYQSERIAGKWEKLLYIDLRFGNKVYFKFR